jgi:hypothetical protein
MSAIDSDAVSVYDMNVDYGLFWGYSPGLVPSKLLPRQAPARDLTSKNFEFSEYYDALQNFLRVFLFRWFRRFNFCESGFVNSEFL